MQYANVPEELKVLPRWVVYRLVDYVDKNGKKKKNKIPYNPITGFEAKAGQPQTWGRFEEAVSALNTVQAVQAFILYVRGMLKKAQTAKKLKCMIVGDSSL